ncbi:glycosyltransferase [Sulfolobus islandicus]|uniref:Glycosyl transferase family 2 n=1 Tax=Saccharolobus islandicus (strain HVE10/4) TaxID=930943 RepID=F0NJG8_SACI0|nr:glycosyltransferase family 2 protein [Sulfolobus islandicus]ADX81833.1 glycosyl transferase family 2 [Sulfolobus islandicus HVE10/4]WCM38572.1 glycosyltransferase [Sulfolobus islandicus]
MLVSIIIPTSNGEKTLPEVLNSILIQDYKNFEIIIIDNGSKDNTEKIVKKFLTENDLNLKYFKYENKLGHAGAINEGIKKASGDFLLILHDDMKLGEKNWISSMLKVFERKEVGVSSSLLVTSPFKLNGINKAFSYIYILGWHKIVNIPEQEVLFTGLNNDIIRREVIEKIGMFDNTYPYSMHDIDFSEKVRRLGYKIILNPKVHVEHLLSSYQRSLKSHLIKAWQYGFPSTLILKRYKYLPNLDNFLFFIFIIFFFMSFFINKFDILLYISIAITLLTLPLEQPNFYGKNKLKNRGKKLIISYILSSLFYLLNENAFFLFLGGSVIFYRTLKSSIESLKELKDIKTSLQIIIFYLIWSFINGLAVFAGIFKFLVAHDKVKLSAQ